jgi:catechol 2,3-dioxygenase-like lactoylglutathione lyase family enzyme
MNKSHTSATVADDHQRTKNMNRLSAVEFATETRIHIGLAVKDLAVATSFYETLFGQPPSKTRPGYAKFEVAEPAVNLSLNQIAGETGPRNAVAHYGIQVKSTDAVARMRERFAGTGMGIRVEDNVTCCYAVQDKVWVADPDGNKWEVFVVLDNEGPQHAQSGSCCPDTVSCCSETDKKPVELIALGCCR